MMPEDESILTRNARPADRIMTYGAEPVQDMEVRFGGETAGKRPLVIIIHGGFWRPDIDRAHARPMAEAIAAAGFTVVLPEYSRVAGNPTPTLEDVSRALSQAPARVANHNGQVILVGHSAGGHLALWASAAQRCPGLTGTLALAPVADLLLAHELGLGNGAVARFLGADPVSRPELDPRQMAAPLSATLLVHGDQDAIVPLAVSESYVEAHPRARLVAVPDAGHFAVIDPHSPAWAIVMAQLQGFTDPIA